MILVGTASCTDKALVDSGAFYPPQARTAEARLKYYAAQFLAHVVVDEPQARASPRCGKRLRETWEKKGLAAAAERFNYLYSAEELQALAGPVQALARKAAQFRRILTTSGQDR